MAQKLPSIDPEELKTYVVQKPRTETILTALCIMTPDWKQFATAEEWTSGRGGSNNGV